MQCVSQALASAEYDCDKLCSEILGHARTLCKADRCSLFLVDHVKGELEAHFNDSCAVRMPIHRGIAGHVATTGQVVNIPNAYEDSRFNRAVDDQTGLGLCLCTGEVGLTSVERARGA